MPTRRDADAVMDRDFLATRGRVLEIAAALDRVDQAPERAGSPPDRRMAQLRRAVEALLEPGPGRVETIQRIFSLDYDPHWRPADPAATPRF